MTVKPIETEYKGYRFRSRTEARWAVFFDELGLKWEYEKEGYDLGAAGRYLPDFWFPDFGLWVEIKGGEPTKKEYNKALALCGATQRDVAIFSGSPWFNICRAYFVYTEGNVTEISYWDSGDDWYDYEQKDGNGSYYQGWLTWGLSDTTGEPAVICLVEKDDVRNAQAIEYAYSAARSARFEYGDKGNVVFERGSNQVIQTTDLADVPRCPKCGTNPLMYCNRSSPIFDDWVACPSCKFSGPHDDSYKGAKSAWVEAVIVEMHSRKAAHP